MLLSSLLDYILHLDKHLQLILTEFGAWTYLILFLIILCETGLVVTPFLPGDSLLFAAGALAGTGSLRVEMLLLTLTVAAILGDTINYWLGSIVGQRAFTGAVPFLKQSHLIKTQNFFDRHGNKAIVMARFMPIVRTMAPFVAGVGSMRYGHFLFYNIVGGVTWVVGFTLAGYWFGSLPFVQKNFSWVILAVIVLSVAAIAIDWLKEWWHKPAAAVSKA